MTTNPALRSSATCHLPSRVLPLYLGLRPLSARALWLVFSGYVAGLALSQLSLWLDSASAWTGLLSDIAALLMGSALLLFIILRGCSCRGAGGG